MMQLFQNVHFRVAISFVVLTVILRLDLFVGGEGGIVRFHDTFDSEFARFSIQARDFLDLRLSSWYPYFAGGLPTNAYHFSGLHPFVVMSTLIKPWLLYDLIIAIQTTLGCYGIYRLLTTVFHCRLKVAIFAGALMGFWLSTTQPQLFFIFHYMFAWFLIYLISDQTRRSLWQNILASIAFVFFGLAAYPVINGPLLGFLHVALVFILITNVKDPRVVPVLVAGFLFWIGIALAFVPNLVALLEYLPEIQREYPKTAPFELMPFLSIFFEAFINEISMAVQGIFGPLIIASIVTCFVSSTVRRFCFWQIIPFAFLALFGVKVSPFFADTFLIKMDLVHVGSALVPIQVLYIGISIDRLLRDGRPSLIGSFILLGMLTLVWANGHRNQGDIFVAFAANGLFITACLFVGTLYFSRVYQGYSAACLSLMAPLVILLALAPQFVQPRFIQIYYPEYFGDNDQLVALRNEYDAEPFRVIMIGAPDVVAHAKGLETVGGRSPLFNKHYKAMVEYAVNIPPEREGNIEYFRSNWYDINMDALTGRRPDAEKFNLSYLAMMNTRYILSTTELSGLDRKYFSTDGMSIETVPIIVYKVPDWQHRAFLVSGVEVLATQEDVLSRLADISDTEISRNIFVAKEDGWSVEESSPADNADCGLAETISYESDKLELSIHTNRPCHVLISTNYDVGWKATLNGKSVPVRPANYTFQAVYVDGPGDFTLTIGHESKLGVANWIFVPLGGFLMFLSVFAFRFFTKESGGVTELATFSRKQNA